MSWSLYTGHHFLFFLLKMTITPVGYKLSSKNFIIKFKSARQNSNESKVLEQNTDWTEVMNIVLNTLEEHPTNTKSVSKEASSRLEEWALTQTGGYDLKLRVTVMIYKPDYWRQENKRDIFLHFSDAYRTCVIFKVKKKQSMLSLRTLSAQKVSACLRVEDHINKLELPRDVLPAIHESYYDEWINKKLDTSAQKRKIQELSLNDLRKKKDCPYCGRKNFKKIVTHVMVNDACHLKYDTQLEYNYVINNCFW